MDITIQEVTGKKQMNAFLDLPYALYKNNPYNIPKLRFDEAATLNPKKNPAFDFCEARYWLAYQDGKVVGRVAAIYNKKYVERWKNNYLRFGWIDFIEDINVAKALVSEVENWAKVLGCTAVHGPLGFTDLDYEGMLIEGFEERGTMATIYNYPYYPKFMEELGYGKAVDWVEYRIHVPKELPENILKIANLVERRFKLHVVPMKSTKDLKPYAKEVFQLVNETYAELYGVVELSQRQIDYYVKMYFSMIRVDFITLIANEQNKLVGFGISMPSLSKALQKANGSLFPFGFIHLLTALKKNDEVDLLLIGIDKSLQGKGVNAIVLREFNKNYAKAGIVFAESNPELEENTKVQSTWQHFDARQHKRRRCFIKQL